MSDSWAGAILLAIIGRGTVEAGRAVPPMASLTHIATASSAGEAIWSERLSCTAGQAVGGFMQGGTGGLHIHRRPGAIKLAVYPSGQKPLWLLFGPEIVPGHQCDLAPHQRKTRRRPRVDPTPRKRCDAASVSGFPAQLDRLPLTNGRHANDPRMRRGRHPPPPPRPRGSD